MYYCSTLFRCTSGFSLSSAGHLGCSHIKFVSWHLHACMKTRKSGIPDENICEPSVGDRQSTSIHVYRSSENAPGSRIILMTSGPVAVVDATLLLSNAGPV